MLCEYLTESIQTQRNSLFVEENVWCKNNNDDDNTTQQHNQRAKEHTHKNVGIRP